MRTSPMFPLGTVLLPGAGLPLRVFEPRYVALVEACQAAEDLTFGVVLISRGSEVGGGEVRTDVGVIARMQSCVRMPGDRFAMACRGEDRFRVVRWLEDDPFPRAEIELWPDVTDGDDSAALALVFEKRDELNELVRQLADQTGNEPRAFAMSSLPSDPSKRSFSLTSSLPISEIDKQRALAAAGPVERLQVLAEALDDVVATLRFRLM